MVLLKDGSALLTVSGQPREGHFGQVGVFRTKDRGETWELLSVVKTDHDLSETAAVQLQNGRLVMASRRQGNLAWSDDGGFTWTKPVTFGMPMFAPSLYVLRDGTLVCLFSSQGLRMIFSRDGGETWIAPGHHAGLSGGSLLRLRQSDGTPGRFLVHCLLEHRGAPHQGCSN